MDIDNILSQHLQPIYKDIHNKRKNNNESIYQSNENKKENSDNVEITKRQKDTNCCYLQTKEKYYSKQINIIKQFFQSSFMDRLTTNQQKELLFQFFSYKIQIKEQDVFLITKESVWTHITKCLMVTIIERDLELKIETNDKLKIIKRFELSSFMNLLKIDQQKQLITQYYKSLMGKQDINEEQIWNLIALNTKPIKQDKIIKAKREMIEEEDLFSKYHKKVKLYNGPIMLHNGLYQVPVTCKVDNLKLARINAHERDQHIIFDEEPHLYYLKGKPVSISVTSLLHSFFSEFLEEETIKKMIKNNKTKFPYKIIHEKYKCLPIWCTTSYIINGNSFTRKETNLEEWQEGADLRDEQTVIDCIKNCWEDIRVDASSRGTKLHRNCELYVNDEPVYDDSKEFKMFLKYIEDMRKKGYIPYRSEQVLWSEELDLAGSVDIQFVKIDLKTGEKIINPKTGKNIYYLGDWKRSKQIKLYNEWENGIGIMADYNDCNFIHYTLQLNL